MGNLVSLVTELEGQITSYSSRDLITATQVATLSIDFDLMDKTRCQKWQTNSPPFKHLISHFLPVFPPVPITCPVVGNLTRTPRY